MTYAKRVISILAVMAGLGAAGVFFGPHRDSALASFDGLMANLQFPLPLPGDAKIRPGVIGQSVNGAGLNVYVGATDVPVDQMFDYYSENFDVLLRQEEATGGTLAFMAKDAADGVSDVDGLAQHLFVVQAKRNPEATQTSFVVGVPQENFRLADFARTEVGDSADGDLPDVPRMPGAARVVAMDRSNVRGGAEQRLFVYKGPGDAYAAADFYRQAMPQYGWRLAAASPSEPGFLFFQKGGRLAQITLSDREDEGAVYASVSYTASR